MQLHCKDSIRFQIGYGYRHAAPLTAMRLEEVNVGVAMINVYFDLIVSFV